jgi:site-specific recombinase XerC
VSDHSKALELERAHDRDLIGGHGARAAAIRMMFDWLATGGILPFNPATAVRGPKHVVKRGKTPVLAPEEARQLLDSIDVNSTRVCATGR